MNINIVNIGDYRLSSYGKYSSSLSNTKTDESVSLPPSVYEKLNQARSIEACQYAFDTIKKGIDVA